MAKLSRKTSRNKYGAKKQVLDGVTFDSKKEAVRWLDLKFMESRGIISDLKRQVKVELMGQNGPLYTRTGRKMRLTFDFTYFEDDVLIYEDVKGMPTRDYEVRIAVVRAMGLKVRET